jgi:hypothetical protein
MVEWNEVEKCHSFGALNKEIKSMKVMHDLPKNIVKYKHLTAIEQFREAANTIYNPMTFVGTVERVRRRYQNMFADISDLYDIYEELKNQAYRHLGQDVMDPVTDKKKLRVTKGLLSQLNRHIMKTVKVLDFEITKVANCNDQVKAIIATGMPNYTYVEKLARFSELYVLKERVNEVLRLREKFAAEQEKLLITYQRPEYGAK